MKNLLFIILISLFFSCNNKTTHISELNFSDLNHKNILKNNIRKTFLISGHDSAIYKKNDTIEIIEYDTYGNIKKVWRKSFMYSINEEYEYDSLNFETQKIYYTDFKAIFNFRYEFDKDSLILYKFYVPPSTGVSIEDIAKPAGVFKFNSDGKISESFQYQNNDYGRGKKLTTKYYYDTLNLLSSKEVTYESSDMSFNSEAITNYYYSDKKLDSTITILQWIDYGKQNYSTKVIFDDKGLISKRIVMDSLITYYKHIK